MPARCLLAAWLTLFAMPSAQAHGGGLDKQGCHNERATGGYHCHRGPAAAAPHVPREPRDDDLPLSPGRNARPSGVFANCTEARAAGAAPVHRGDPGYGPHLDRDGDGIGCEPYRRR
jgi:hypothetical protein